MSSLLLAPSETDAKQAAVSMSSNFGQLLSDRQDRWISHLSQTHTFRGIKFRLSIWVAHLLRPILYVRNYGRFDIETRIG